MRGKRLAWMAAGGAVTLAVKARAEHAVADEARRLQQRLPASAGRVVDRLPPEVTRAAGVAVVAGRTARSGVQVGYRVAVVGGRSVLAARTAVDVAVRATAQGGATVHDVARRVQVEVRDVRRGWTTATADEERLLRADLARLDGDEAGALEVLLDRRAERPRPPVPEVPAPVPAGRQRAVPAAPEPPVDRAQRSYRRPHRLS